MELPNGPDDVVAVAGADDPNKLDDADEAGVPNGLDVDDWVVDPNMEDDGVDDEPNGEEDTVVAAAENGEFADEVMDDPNNEEEDDGV